MQEKITNTSELNEQNQSAQTIQAKAKPNGGVEQTMFGPKPPIQTKEGRKGPIKAKQRPIRRKRGNSAKSAKIAEAMGEQYKTDTSQLNFHHNSSFPSSVGADATIQGKNIHFAPGKDTEANIKHEVAHDILNTKRGTPPVADKTIKGQPINTTDEAAADQMMNAPLQMKAEGQTSSIGEGRGNSSSAHRNAPIQRLVSTEIKSIRKGLITDHGQIHLAGVTDEKLWEVLDHVTSLEGLDIDQIGPTRTERLLISYAFLFFLPHELRFALPGLNEIKRKLAERNLEEDQIERLMHNPAKLSSIAVQLIADRPDVVIPRFGVQGSDFTPEGQTDVRQIDALHNGEDVSHHLGRLMAEATMAKPEIDQQMNDVGKDLKGRMNVEVRPVPIKSWGRAHDKATRNLQDGEVSKGGAVLDLLRGSIIFDSVADMISALEHEIPRAFNVIRTYGSVSLNNTSYQDVKLYVASSRGHIAEVQLHVKEMIEAKDKGGGHELYNFTRAALEGRIYKPAKPEECIKELNTIRAKLDATPEEEVHEGVAGMRWVSPAIKELVPDALKARCRALLDTMEAGVNSGEGTNLRANDGLSLASVIGKVIYQSAAKKMARERAEAIGHDDADRMARRDKMLDGRVTDYSTTVY